MFIIFLIFYIYIYELYGQLKKRFNQQKFIFLIIFIFFWEETFHCHFFFLLSTPPPPHSPSIEPEKSLNQTNRFLLNLILLHIIVLNSNYFSNTTIVTHNKFVYFFGCLVMHVGRLCNFSCYLFFLIGSRIKLLPAFEIIAFDPIPTKKKGFVRNKIIAAGQW